MLYYVTIDSRNVEELDGSRRLIVPNVSCSCGPLSQTVRPPSYPLVNTVGSGINRWRDLEADVVSAEKLTEIRDKIGELMPPGLPVLPLLEISRYYRPQPVTRWSDILRQKSADNLFLAAPIFDDLVEMGLENVLGFPIEINGPGMEVRTYYELQVNALLKLDPDCFPGRKREVCKQCGRYPGLLQIEDQRLAINRSELPQSGHVFSLAPFINKLLVSEAFKKAFEAMGIQGLQFHPVKLEGSESTEIPQALLHIYPSLDRMNSRVDAHKVSPALYHINFETDDNQKIEGDRLSVPNVKCSCDPTVYLMFPPSYPLMDVSGLPGHKKSLSGCVLPLEEFLVIKEALAPYALDGLPILPMIAMGVFKSKPVSKFRDLFRVILQYDVFLSETVFTELLRRGFDGLVGCPLTISNRKKESRLYFELQINSYVEIDPCRLPGGEANICPLCGRPPRSLCLAQHKIVFNRKSLPNKGHLFAATPEYHIRLVSRALKEALVEMKVTGLRFRPATILGDPQCEIPQHLLHVSRPQGEPVPLPFVVPKNPVPAVISKPKKTAARKLDYAAWLKKLVKRVEAEKLKKPDDPNICCDIQPVLSSAQIEELRRKVAPMPLLPAYARFLEQACGGVDFHFNPLDEDGNEIYAGGVMFMARELLEDIKSGKEWAEETWIAESEENKELWLNGLPFIHLANGDIIAMDIRSDPEDPAVLYLSHDDDSRELSPSLSRFLKSWEKLGYIGPEIWILEPHLDEDGQL